jgi:hypothetical protein
MSENLSIQVRAQKVKRVAERLRPFLNRERGAEFSESEIGTAVMGLIEKEFDLMVDDLEDVLTSPGRSEYKSLLNILENRSAPEVAGDLRNEVEIAHAFGDENVFSGYKPFSKQKLAAMIEYLTNRGFDIYTTQLNKLLFYADLHFFDLESVSISGATHLHRPFGPVADQTEPLLKELQVEGRIDILKSPQRSGVRVKSQHGPMADSLSGKEQKLLDWVLSVYGKMSAREISELSHSELGYKYTKPNQPIAYKYAQFLKHRPPRDLFE